jgi:hypothetical protein
MADLTQLSTLTREQLYELVWSTPGTKLAAKLGVSDVAIFKRCRVLGVPRPERGYWAKLEFGKADKKPALPPSLEEKFARQAATPLPASAPLPTESAALHPLAQQFLTAVKAAAISYDKQRVHLRQREFPEADISKTQALRAAQAFHALLNLLEPRGVLFKRSRGHYDGGGFRKGNDDLHLKIEEELVEKPPATIRRRSYYSSGPSENKIAGGKLTFTVNPDRYGRTAEKCWPESEKLPLETIVSEMAKAIIGHYFKLQEERAAETVRREKERAEWEIRRKKEQAEEAIRQTEEAKRKHADALEKAARARQEDLVKASAWWKIHREIEEFIAECERRWTASSGAQLTPDQQAWLTWAHEVAKSASPFESGYPEATRDGTFDSTTVPFGGPYPQMRKFPRPPTMPDMPAPVVVQQSYGAPGYSPEPKPFPFWLKYQRR